VEGAPEHLSTIGAVPKAGPLLALPTLVQPGLYLELTNWAPGEERIE